MQIKALLLDFDGTSLQRDQIWLSMRTMYDIRALLRKGILVIPCTGRAADMLPPQIQAEEEIRYLVTSGGGRVTDRRTGELIAHTCFTPEISARLCRVFEGREIYAELTADGRIVMEKEVADHLERHPVPPHHVWFMEQNRQQRAEKPSEYFAGNRLGMEKGNLYGLSGQQRNRLAEALTAGGQVKITDAGESELEFFPKNVSKLSGAESLLDRLGISLEETMSIGDGQVDASMIRACGIGVAMGNAPEPVKAQADHVTAGFDQEGAALAIERFLL